jgi:antitoxin component YwqK of YwqJK toxin-antitoxin module
MRRIYCYPNGQLLEKYSYANGNKHGEYIYYYSNGQVWSKCFYVNGEWHGEYIDYNRYGSINRHRLYVDGYELKDLKESPVYDEEKMLLTLQYGVEWL